SKHVLGGAPGAVGEVVLADAVQAGAMVDRHFGDLVAGVPDERGNKAMHAIKRHQCGAALASHGFEGTAGIANAIADETATHSVGDAALETLVSGVFSLGAITADEIETFVELFDEGGNIRGIVLQIAVDEHDNFAARGLDARVHGSA